ncbi:MAG: 23S rRNA (adenine(1618)-N(6))-methyltransferase RlmF [Flavobacteriales bacterium]|nr:23S rRNA (adenine(1618)-N(6))-methyltransferase RlmF [Flavobacteriales bacterium]
MSGEKKVHPKVKSSLHPRNKHRERYDFKQLTESHPELGPFVKLNAYQDESIEFSDPLAVKTLNKALLKHHYGITFWDVPEGYLCPPIPGRADYLHHIAGLLGESNYGNIPTGDRVLCLDIGVGANCVYPMLGAIEYGWSFIGTDIDPTAVANAKVIVEQNEVLEGKIDIRLQSNPKDVLYGVIRIEDRVDLTICNPPFHASLEEAQAGTLRKVNNLNHKKVAIPTKNFGGQNSELWCDGGEKRFIRNLIHESKKFSTSVFWFSTLISKQSNLKSVYGALKAAEVVEVKTIPMGQGNKTSRIVAWTFLKPHQQRAWRETRWNLSEPEKA